MKIPIGNERSPTEKSLKIPIGIDRERIGNLSLIPIGNEGSPTEISFKIPIGCPKNPIGRPIELYFESYRTVL